LKLNLDHIKLACFFPLLFFFFFLKIKIKIKFFGAA
jgi:hypothetical protein